MNASSESGLWATRIMRGMGPRGRKANGRTADGLEERRGSCLASCPGAFRFRRVLVEILDDRLVLLVFRPAGDALGGEMGPEVALGLTQSHRVVLDLGHTAPNDVAEQVTRVASQDGVRQRQGAGEVSHLNPKHG